MNASTLNIVLNGEQHLCRQTSLTALLAEHTRPEQSFAVAVNAQFVPRSAYEVTQLQNGDRVEILIPMQGG